MKLTFVTMPVSTNLLYGHVGKKKYLTERGRENQQNIGWEAQQQYRGEPLKEPLKVKVALWWGDKRKHDVDNIKVLLDSLSGIVWVDDSQIERLEITKGVDGGNPRVEMRVTTI